MDAQELELLEARWRIGEITHGDLHAVADDLLQAGVDTPALIELFALTPDEARWKGAPIFERVLEELGAGGTTEAEAATVLARHIARMVLDGSISASEATSQAAGLVIRTAGHTTSSSASMGSTTR